MIHTYLYRLEKNQKKCLTLLGFLFLVFSIAWFVIELMQLPFPMEPVVVFTGGAATLLASFWPWKAPYQNRRRRGREEVDYTSNNKKFKIGSGDMEFTLQFSICSGEKIYIYNDPENIYAVAIAAEAGNFKDIKDVTAFDFSNQAIDPAEAQIVCLKNTSGNYALVHIHDIKNADRGDGRNEVTFSYVINPDGGTDFS